MNKAFVASIVLGGWTGFAFAQESAIAAPGTQSGANTCADCRAGQLHYEGDAPGGHDVGVFTSVPTISSSDWSTGPRRVYGRLSGFGPGDGIGSFTLGRQYNLEYLAQGDVGDLLHTGTFGKASNLVTPSGFLANNDVRYYSSRKNGVSTDSSWTVDTLGGNSMANRAWGMTVGYDVGSLSLRAAHQNRHVAQVQLYNLVGNTMDAKNSIIAANFRMRWGTAYAAYRRQPRLGQFAAVQPGQSLRRRHRQHLVDRQPRHHYRRRRTGHALDHFPGIVHPQERPRPGQS
jgi:hypothetical protein